jgi:Acetyltransferase (GNAT) domain
MTVSVRRANPESDRGELLDLLQANLPQLPHAQYFDWLYRNNPEGLALTWVATDTGGRRLIGMASAFPRRTYHLGSEVPCYVLGDFCIVPEYRSLGLALTLQRTCLAGLSEQGARFALDFPSDGMLAVYRRLGIQPDRTMVRYAKMLRANRKIAEHVAGSVVAYGLTVVANGILKLRDTRSRRRTTWTIAKEDGPCGEEFTQTALEWSLTTRNCAARTADFLNWRYHQHPLWQFEVLTARGEGKLHGYLIQHPYRDDYFIDEVMGEDEAVRRDLLLEAIAIARARGVQTLCAPWLSSHSLPELLRDYGFLPRESHPVVLLSWLSGEGGPAGDKQDWYVSGGDGER